MSNKKQSSIEWLADEINVHLNFDQRLYLRELLEQAKAMHKEEMDKVAGCFWNEGASYMYDGKRRYKSFDEYYNETFGGNNE